MQFVDSKKMNEETGQCDCKENFLWSEQYYMCYFDCELDSHAVQVVYEFASACKCESGYKWSYDKVGCYLNCSDYEFALAMPGPTQETCSCQEGFSWVNGECALQCSGPYDGEKVEGENQCGCEDGAVWDPVDYRCEIDCTLDDLSVTA